MEINDLKSIVFKGAKSKNLELSEKVLDRLTHELSVINCKGFIDYFILYSKIIEVCNDLKLIRSAGRGTAPSSLVNYCLDITNINPLEHNFRFEKFIHPNQTSLPDIDIDIPLGYKEFVIDEFKKRFLDCYIYSIAYNPKDENGKDYTIFFNNKCFKKHSTGYTITIDPISEKTLDIKNEVFYICEDYLQDPFMNYKVDFVELDCLNNYNSYATIDEIYPYQIPLNEEKILDVFRDGKTEKIFGFNNTETAEILREFQPDSINDLALIFAVNRPPLNKWLPIIIKNKLENIIPAFQSYDRVNSIQSESYGVVVYQEQFLDILIDVVGMTYTDAYNWLKKLQRDNTKVNQTLFHIEFSNKCFENTKLNTQEIEKLACLLLDTCQWTFQKTHALSYAILAYWGAYYQVNYPQKSNVM